MHSLTFAIVYLLLGLPHDHPVSPQQAAFDALLISVTAIHGRALREQLGTFSEPAWVASVESVVGILIEGVFVAMLIRRFFGR